MHQAIISDVTQNLNGAAIWNYSYRRQQPHRWPLITGYLHTPACAANDDGWNPALAAMAGFIGVHDAAL